ncbi:MAG: hypothetical protein LBL94_12280 [Prevotellaceae bacterium]|jgi:hypothetical protein|nr:hypothetical protein [Prevotellaceae bacterium]
MPGHYSLRDTSVERYIDKKYAKLPLFITNTLFCDLPSSAHLNSPEKVEDVSVITSDFLIRHIDQSFQRWHSIP